MVEWIRAIPGPTFLLIFTLVWAFLSVILWVWLKYDGTNKLYIPEWASMNPYTIAYLRDGAEAVLHTAFFSLYDKGYLRLTGRNLQDYDIVRSVKDRKVMVNAVERALYAHCIYPRSMGDVLNDTILLSRLDDLMAPIQEDLIDEGLLKSTRQHMVAISKVIIIIGTLIVFGGIKWNLGVQNDRPVGFLTIMLIIYPIITIVLLRPQGLHTAAGKRLLSQLEDHYSWLQLLIGDGRSPVGINPAFVVADGYIG